MIDSAEKLINAIRIQYRFLSIAAIDLGFKGNRDYQRFRNTALGLSKDYQVILALDNKFPKINTKSIWDIDKKKLVEIKQAINA